MNGTISCFICSEKLLTKEAYMIHLQEHCKNNPEKYIDAILELNDTGYLFHDDTDAKCKDEPVQEQQSNYKIDNRDIQTWAPENFKLLYGVSLIEVSGQLITPNIGGIGRHIYLGILF